MRKPKMRNICTIFEYLHCGTYVPKSSENGPLVFKSSKEKKLIPSLVQVTLQPNRTYVYVPTILTIWFCYLFQPQITTCSQPELRWWSAHTRSTATRNITKTRTCSTLITSCPRTPRTDTITATYLSVLAQGAALVSYFAWNLYGMVLNFDNHR